MENVTIESLEAERAAINSKIEAFKLAQKLEKEKPLRDKYINIKTRFEEMESFSTDFEIKLKLKFKLEQKCFDRYIYPSDELSRLFDWTVTPQICGDTLSKRQKAFIKENVSVFDGLCLDGFKLVAPEQFTKLNKLYKEVKVLKEELEKVGLNFELLENPVV